MLLSEAQIEDLYSGNVPTTNLIALWTFDNFTNPFYTPGNRINLNVSYDWGSGDVLVSSDAPFESTNLELTEATHLLLSDTDYVVSFLPEWASGDSVTVVTISGVSISQFLANGCAGASVSASHQISNSEGLSHALLFFLNFRLGCG